MDGQAVIQAMNLLNTLYFITTMPQFSQKMEIKLMVSPWSYTADVSILFLICENRKTQRDGIKSTVL